MIDKSCTLEPSFLRLWWRSGGQWLNRRFDASDPAWRDTFTSLVGTCDVRLQYLSRTSSQSPLPDLS